MMKQIRPYVFVAENNVGIAYFRELPRCDFCGEPARFDAMTNLPGHPAAYFCERCFPIYARMPPPWLTILEKQPKVEYQSDAVPVITVPVTLETVFWDVFVLCPHCGAQFHFAELDAEGVRTCSCCGNQYMLRSELVEGKPITQEDEDHPPKWLEEYFDEILSNIFKDYPNRKKRKSKTKKD